jgi:hypothetical protein
MLAYLSEAVYDCWRGIFRVGARFVTPFALGGAMICAPLDHTSSKQSEGNYFAFSRSFLMSARDGIRSFAGIVTISVAMRNLYSGTFFVTPINIGSSN